MRINYPNRSKFLEACLNTIERDKNDLNKGYTVSITFSERGYDGNVRVTIEKTNPHSFQTDWKSQYPSRFSVRIKAAALALYIKGYFGDFQISHYRGEIKIQSIKHPSVEDDIRPNCSTIDLSIEFVKQTPIKSNIQYELNDILKKIPFEVWQLIVRKEPEWHLFEPLSSKFAHGSFSVLMLAAGLNAFQLKGKAETGYWPQLYKYMENYDSGPLVDALYEYLVEFYRNERLNSLKIERLSRFFCSPLADHLWTKSPREISSMTNHIWHSLGNVMGQKLHDKTICFAMKCLGISLMMQNEFNFDFQDIPIPVDSRIVKFTRAIIIDIEEKIHIIQDFWKNILSSIKLSMPQINMIHLDSLIWQIAHHNPDEVKSYFEDLGIGDSGKHIAHMLKDINLAPKQNTISDPKDNSKFPFHSFTKYKRILILFPCSGRKLNYVTVETFRKNEEKRVIDILENTGVLLISGRDGLSECIDYASDTIPALDRYDGFLYRSAPNFRNSIKQAVSNENIRVLILSGAYGLVTPSERIHNYDQKMDASYWKSHGLSKIIEDFIVFNKITHVYGFFSKSTDYMKILMNVKWANLRARSNLQSAIAYYVELSNPGGALKIVPHILGKLIISFIRSGFNDDDFYKNPFHGQYIVSKDLIGS